MTQLITLEYDGMPVDFTGEAWFNATKVAEKFGKEPYEWLRSPDTVAYLAALERKHGGDGQKLSKPGKSRFVLTRRGGRVADMGTWMHPKLGVPFARWLDVDFAIWCDEQIEAILRGRIADWRRSTVEERFDMQIGAMKAAQARRKPWSHVMGWGNRWAGVTRSRYLSVGLVREVGGFYGRVETRSETPEDLARIEANSIALYGESPQLPLLGMGVGK